MVKILEKLELKIDKIVDKMVPRFKKKFDEMILTKFNDKGLQIAYWVSSVLSKIFFIYLLTGFIMNIYSYSINIYYKTMNIMISYNWLENLLLDLIIPMLVLPIPYVLMRLTVKLLSEKVTDEIDQSSLFFATGIFLILNNFTGIIRIFTSVSNLVYQMQLGDKINFMIFVHPFINTIIPIMYIIIGYKYIKRSNCIQTN